MFPSFFHSQYNVTECLDDRLDSPTPEDYVDFLCEHSGFYAFATSTLRKLSYTQSVEELLESAFIDNDKDSFCIASILTNYYFLP